MLSRTRLLEKYLAVMRAIVQTGYNGFVAHEFTTKKANEFEAIRDAVNVCDV